MSPLDFNEKIFALMQREHLTYREACSRLGRRGAAARANKRRRIAHERQRLERMHLV